jgi:hypothetical protein
MDIKAFQMPAHDDRTGYRAIKNAIAELQRLQSNRTG